MRFPIKFTRQFGAVSSDPLVGSDANPVGDAPRKAACYGSWLGANISGWPVQRVCVAIGMSTGTPLVTVTNVWVRDENSGLWFIAGSGNVTPGLNDGSGALGTGGKLTWFDLPVLADPPQGGAPGAVGNYRQGALDVFVQVLATGFGAGQNAVYTIIAGPDSSSAV